MDNIEELLRALAGEDDGETGGAEQGGGLFEGLDAAALMKLLELIEGLNKPNNNERFLLALKPLLREENRPKVDTALRFMKLFALLPVLRESGIMGELL